MTEQEIKDAIFKENNKNESYEPVFTVSENHGEFLGYCKWFNSKIGYGFIKVMDGEHKSKDIFVHHSGIEPKNSNFKTLTQGEYISLNITNGKNGLQAINVSGVNGGPLMCDNNIHTPYNPYFKNKFNKNHKHYKQNGGYTANKSSN
jgi:CspA family cold shock protein